MISVALPLITARPSTPGVSLPTSMSSASSTMSTISSTTSPIERPPSENTSSGCVPSLAHARRRRSTGTSGISWPRYCTRWRPFESSILLAVDLLQPRDERERHRLRLRRAGAEHQEANASSRRARPDRPRCRTATGDAARRVCAMPFGSMIMITEPSPRMVLPENIAMWRSLVDIGFTTISSVWNTPSTTMPNVWLPTCVTTMKPFSAVARRRRAQAASCR